MDFNATDPVMAEICDAGVPVEVFDYIIRYGALICINYGTQIGASLLLFVVLLLLTRPEKRMTAIFFLNAFSLALNFIRLILACLYFTGPFYTIEARLLYQYGDIPQSSYRNSSTALVLTLILVICIEISLILQVRAVCVTMRVWARRAVMVLSVLIALVPILFHFWVAIKNIQYINKTESFSDQVWLAAAECYTLAGSIFFFSLVFFAKLGLALKQRRKLGLRQFGPMEIILIMISQTLVVPLVFAIVTNLVYIPGLFTQAITITVINLPLSALWAAASMTGSTTSSFGSFKRQKPDGASGSTASSGRTVVGDSESPVNKTLFTPSTIGSNSRKCEGDLELGHRDILVKRTVEVEGTHC